MDKKIISFIWLQYGGRIVCTFLSVILGLVYLVAGLWKMIIFSILIASGYYIGRYVDRKENWKDIIDKIFFSRGLDK